MHTIREILSLAERYAAARRISATTLARQATGSSTWLERCERGRVTFESASAFVAWLSEHWPPGLEWPPDIERPEGAHDARSRARRPSDPAAPPVRVGTNGEVASPGALCRALGVSRFVYAGVVRRYRDGAGATHWPRAGSASERVLGALVALGDVRFASRRPRDAA